MPAPCSDCLRGPTGIGGHEGLFVDTMSGARLGFSCRVCELHWARTYAGEGAFSWEVRNRAATKTHDIGWAVPNGFGQGGGD